jgi:hypothetical protein
VDTFSDDSQAGSFATTLGNNDFIGIHYGFSCLSDDFFWIPVLAAIRETLQYRFSGQIPSAGPKQIKQKINHRSGRAFLQLLKDFETAVCLPDLAHDFTIALRGSFRDVRKNAYMLAPSSGL